MARIYRDIFFNLLSSSPPFGIFWDRNFSSQIWIFEIFRVEKFVELTTRLVFPVSKFSSSQKEYGRIEKMMIFWWIFFSIHFFFETTDSPPSDRMERGNITDNEISSVRSRGPRSRARSSIINVDWRRGPRGHAGDDSSSSHGACIRASRVRSSSIYAEQFNDNGALRGERRRGFKDLRGREPATPRSRPPPPATTSSSFSSSSSSFFLLRRARARLLAGN